MSEQRRGRVEIEPGAKRVRTYLGGEVVADTHQPLLVWEVPYYPAYYFPRGDVRTELLSPSDRTEHSPSRGEARYYHVKGGASVAEDAAWAYPDSPIEALRDLIRFDWYSMDAWFEEDEEVYVHPRDPHTRVDILPSSRHVEVIVDGVTVAETRKPTLLFETGLPPRFYVPKVDVRMDLLVPSDTTSGCPYKGLARYWSVRTGRGAVEDLAWSYPTPLPESQKIAGLVCFYNERVDLRVDGDTLARPHTKFS
ncbi:MAG TPA: DUF427 domain-containing protein [Acidimicrobiia bacterium]|jgi:uncharacterized protein (DUF427 family)|nr:DUF427 domain-containing protein [Acidimicrobiia bacterium]